MVTPLGHDAETTWSALKSGKSGVSFITDFPTERLRSDIAAAVRDYDPKKHLSSKESEIFGRVVPFSLGAAAYYAPQGIRINVIAPALVATPMSERAQADPQIMSYVARRQPLSTGILHPADLVGAALFLLSDDARVITGQVLDVDGGWSLTDGYEEEAGDR